MKSRARHSGLPTSLHRRLLNHRRDQRGITLIETIIAMVVTSTVLLPALGFITLTMGEQATARTLTQETSNVAAVDLALVRDVSNAKIAASSTTDTGLQRAPGQLRDCPAAPDTGAGGSVVLALVTSKNYRVVYSLVTGPNPNLGKGLWRRSCPNQSTNADATLGDPALLNSPDSAPTEGALLAQRVGSATSSCPKGDGQQDLNCRQVVLRLQSSDKSAAGSERAPVVVQATRRNTSYAAPNTPPNARFTWQPHQVEEGDVVTFDAGGSNDPRGASLTYKWSFGAPLNTSNPSFSGALITTVKTIPFRPTQAQPAPMQVTLTVRNTAGLESTDTKTVDLNAKRPTASLLPNPPIVKIQNQAVQFTPTLTTYSAATISSAVWDWGDGGTPEVACSPGGTSCTTPKSHTWTDLGTKIVKVTVTDSNGRTASAQVAVKIDPDTVFVAPAPAGVDNATCGIITSPCRQVNYGLNRAESLGKPKVYVAGGGYDRFSARSNIAVSGGWNAAFTTQNATSTITGTAAGEPYGILAAGVRDASVKRFTVATPTVSGATTQGVLVRSSSGTAAKPVVLEAITVAGGSGNQPSGMTIDGSYVTLTGVNVTSPTATGTGSSAYGVRVKGSTVTSTGSTFVANAGLAGASGTSSPPGNAPNGCAGNNGSVGGAPGNSCGGGAGRGGWGNGWYFERGENGANGTNGGGGGSGGGRGGFLDQDAYSGNGGGGANNGASVGGAGGAGGAATPAGGAGATWLGNAGASGTRGGNGGGGGGGGGGSGNAGFGRAGGGGSGGGGGEGGYAGTSVGQAGGGSFGVYAYQSTVNVTGGTIKTAAGGTGGSGQPGGNAGYAGGGGTGARDDGGNEGGGGGGGGAGGGAGAGAGGGAGGPSIGLFLRGSGGGLNGTTVNPLGAAGAGGGGGGRGGAGSGAGGGGGDDGHNGTGGAGGQSPASSNGANGATGLRANQYSA